MIMWFLEDDARLSRERAAIDALDDSAPWLKGPTWFLSGSNLAVQADIEVGNNNYSVVLEYPVFFPAIPPTVSPRDSNELWSGHQYLRSGELCLEWGPDNWEPHITGADMLESTFKLLSTEKDDGNEHQRVVASRHEASLGQDFRGSVLRVAVPPKCDEFLTNLPEGSIGTFDFTLVYRDGNGTLHIQSVHPEGGDPWIAPDLPKTLISNHFSRKGRFARTELTRDSFAGVSRDTLKAALEVCGCDSALPPMGEDNTLSILVLRNKSPDLIALWLPTKESDSVMQLHTFQIGADDSSRRGTGRELVGSKRVGVVGLGSAGSKITISLARSGVRDFLLVDDDIFLPENVERHTLDYRNVGEHKVDGVKGQLEALTAHMKVEVAQLKLSGQEASSSVSYRLKQLSNCDLVVDATADCRTFNVLAEVVKRTHTAMVWLEVFAGGIGGFVARYRPGKDPDPLSIRARFNSYLKDKEPAPVVSAEPYAGQAEDGEPLIATDVDVGIISHHAAKLALDILEEREPSGFPNSLYLIGLERRWLFEAPFHTIGLNVGEPIESLSDKAELLSQENIDFLGKVIKRDASASKD